MLYKIQVYFMPVFRRDKKGRIWIQTTVYVLEEHRRYLEERDLKITRVLADHLSNLTGIPLK